MSPKFHGALKALAFFVLLLILGCSKFGDFAVLNENEWKPSLAVPLLYTTVDIYDILDNANADDDLIIINENTGLVALSYKGELVSLSPNAIIQLPDQNGTFNITSPVSVMPGTGTVSSSTAFTQSLTTNGGVELTSITFKSGDLSIAIGNTMSGATGNVTVSIPSLSKDGNLFNQTVNFNTSESLDLTGYTLDLSTGSQGFNEIPMNVNFTLNATAGQSIPNPAITMTFSMSGQEFEEVHGDFKSQTVIVDRDSILIRIFGELKEVGEITFEDPKINLYAHNSMGFPVRLDFADVHTYNILTNDTHQLFINPSQATFDINFPSIANIGNSVTSTKTLNPSNSTIRDIVSPTPKFLVTDVTATSNPDGVPAQNFLRDDSELRIETEMELPLSGRVFKYTSVDTVLYEFTETVEEIDSVLIRSSITNGFPFDAWVQIYFLDQNDQILDSILPSVNEKVIEAGKINSKGRVSEESTKITDIKYDQDRVDNITGAAKLAIFTRLQTVNGGQDFVKVFDDYEITLKIGMKVDGSVQLGSVSGSEDD